MKKPELHNKLYICMEWRMKDSPICYSLVRRLSTSKPVLLFFYLGLLIRLYLCYLVGQFDLKG